VAEGKPPFLFISYRRGEDSDPAVAIFDAVIDEFGEACVFFDVAGVPSGARFADTIQAQLERATVMVVVIGAKWLYAADEHGRRRIDQDGDWVRREVLYGLEHTTVLPAYIGDAPFPTADALGRALADLTGLQALRLRLGRWDDDVRRLVQDLDRLGFARNKPIVERRLQLLEQRHTEGLKKFGLTQQFARIRGVRNELAEQPGGAHRLMRQVNRLEAKLTGANRARAKWIALVLSAVLVIAGARAAMSLRACRDESGYDAVRSDTTTFDVSVDDASPCAAAVQHAVTLNPFVPIGPTQQLQRFEVSEEEWASVAPCFNDQPGLNRKGSYAKTDVSQEQAQAYCQRLGGSLPDAEVWRSGLRQSGESLQQGSFDKQESSPRRTCMTLCGFVDGVSEMTSEVRAGEVRVMGGAYLDTVDTARPMIADGSWNPIAHQSEAVGFRCWRKQ
jgi:hypothetical protein